MGGGRRQATMRGLLAAVLLAVLIVLGSGNLERLDPALLGYTFATLFAAFAITYRRALWLQRPPTALYHRRGGQLFFRSGRLGHNTALLLRHFAADFLLNRFIWRRGLLRGAAHGLLMWGCGLALAITFPLVFGWVEFAAGDRPGEYRPVVFGLAAPSFRIDSVFGFVVFHALVWPSLLVVAGVVLALRRRLRDEGAAALQQFGEDFLPLLLLFAISVTGLLLTVSYTWMHGYAHDFLALLHALVVIFTLLWLPFGKFFHVFVRPLHLAVGLYKDAGREDEPAHCLRCGGAFASQMHVGDLAAVQGQLGLRYELAGAAGRHYQQVCPACRRALVCLAQSSVWSRPVSPTGPADCSPGQPGLARDRHDAALPLSLRP
jgi:hypothetical protein